MSAVCLRFKCSERYYDFELHNNYHWNIKKSTWKDKALHEKYKELEARRLRLALKNQEQSVLCLSTDLEIWWPWTFEDDADFDALFCFMQTSKFECVIAWIFSSRQGRTAPSKKELVTIERGDINQRVPFFMPLSLEWGHFLLLSYLQFQLNTISFTAVILLQTTWALCRLLHCHGFWSKLIIGNEKTKETLFYSSSVSDGLFITTSP